MGDHHYLGKGIHSNSKQQKVSPQKNDNLQICFNCFSLVFFSKAHISENYSSWHPCCVTRSVIISFVCYNYFKLSPGDVKYHCFLTSLRTKLNFLPLESTLKKIDSSILTRECTGIHFKCLFKILLCIFEILVS